MSADFRGKLIKDLTDQTTGAYRKLISVFDHGEVYIRKYDWASTYNNSLKEVFKKNRMIPLEDQDIFDFLDSDWSTFVNGVAKQLKNTPAITWLHKGGGKINKESVDFNHLKATFYYVRTPTGKTRTSNIDAIAENAVREATINFYKKKELFSRIANLIVESGQVYEHGTRSEVIMSDDNPRSSADFGEGSQTRMEEALASGVTASGAAGTKTSNRLIASLQKELKGSFRKEKWFGVVHSLVKAKWADLFGFDSTLVSADSQAKSAVESELTLRAGMVPNLDDITHNPGTFDKALRAHLKKFLSDQDFFKNEIFKLVVKGKANPNVLNHIDGLFSASPTPKTRIEQAAVKLASAALLDSLSKNVVRKTSQGKKAENFKFKKKRNTTTSKTRGGGVATKQKTPKVTRKRGRPSKQNQALGGNAIALKELINQQLPSRILPKMQSPALVNRTGRFRHSAEVTNVVIGPRGGTQINYTYQRNPYEVFEPGSGSPLANQYRDPRKIIGGTIREIAQQIMQKKFITVRRV